MLYFQQHSTHWQIEACAKWLLFAKNILKCDFLTQNCCILIKISPHFVPNASIISHTPGPYGVFLVCFKDICVGALGTWDSLTRFGMIFCISYKFMGTIYVERHQQPMLEPSEQRKPAHSAHTGFNIFGIPYSPMQCLCGHYTVPIQGAANSLAKKLLCSCIKLYGIRRLMWQLKSHFQHWPSSMMPYGITRLTYQAHDWSLLEFDKLKEGRWCEDLSVLMIESYFAQGISSEEVPILGMFFFKSK